MATREFMIDPKKFEEALAKKSMTIEQFEQKTALNPATISRMKDWKRIRLESLQIACNVLGCDIYDLVYGEQKPRFDVWKKVGDETKFLYCRMLYLWGAQDVHKLLTKKEMRYLGLSIEYMSKFQSVAEDRMYLIEKLSLKPRKEREEEWMGVFYNGVGKPDYETENIWRD